MIFPSPIDIFRIERIFVINPKHQIKFLLIISSQNMLTTNIFHRFHFYCHEDPHTTFFCTPQDAGVVKDARV